MNENYECYANDSRIEIIFKAYGEKKQRKQLAEEMYELLEALQDYYVNRNWDSKLHVIDEISDVVVMLTQFLNDVGVSREELISRMEYKINRQVQRVYNKHVSK